MTASAPRICCLDLDTFFVSVERVLDPTLEGKAVVVGGKPGERGVVTACSYEARAFGVHSGMSLSDAGKLAPQAIYLPGRHGVYSEYSEKVRDIAARFCPVMRVASIDELYLDFAGCERMFARPGDADHDATVLRIVRELTATIKAELGLPSSAGIATSKVLAKVCSALAKPAGVLLVRAGEEAGVLAPLPVRKLPGIGPVAAARLHALGLETLGQVAEAPFDTLSRVFGAWAPSIQRNARGQGSADLGRDRPAFREHDPEGETVGSISNERTFREDIRDPAVLEAMLSGLVERVCWRARKRGIKARTVTLKLRYADFETLTRGRSLPATHAEEDVLPVVKALFRQARTRSTPIRLLGIALSNLGTFDSQGELFEGLGQDGAWGPAPTKKVLGTVDAIRARFGYDAVRRAQSKPPSRDTALKGPP